MAVMDTTVDDLLQEAWIAANFARHEALEAAENSPHEFAKKEWREIARRLERIVSALMQLEATAEWIERAVAA